MDLQEKLQLDLAGKVARAKAHARPWRSLIALLLALACAGVSSWARDHSQLAPVTRQIVAYSAAMAFFVFGLMTTVGLSGKARDMLRPVTGSAHASVIRYTIALGGSILVLVAALDLARIPVTQLLVGGAVTTILIGIAAQQSLGNVFAGVVLLLSRPFTVGDRIRLRSGSLNGPLDGLVTEIGITYMRLETDAGTLYLPNSQVLAAGVGLLPRVPGNGTPEPGG